MPIYAECDICGKKYRFSDNQAGRNIPCKECTADFFVAKPPLLDRRVLIGVGAAIALFLIAIVVIEIVGAFRGPPSEVVSAPLPGTNDPRPTIPRIVPSSTPINQSFNPSAPNVSPGAPVERPPVSASALLSMGPPFEGAPVIESFEPRNLAPNEQVTIRGQGLSNLYLLKAYDILDPTLQTQGFRMAGNETQATVHLGTVVRPTPIVSAPFIVVATNVSGATVTIPRQIMNVPVGQPLPPEYRTLLYVPVNSTKQIGAGAHVVFADTNSQLELNGTTGVFFLRPGARITAAHDIRGLLTIVSDSFLALPNVPSALMQLQPTPKLSFCVVDELLRISSQ